MKNNPKKKNGMNFDRKSDETNEMYTKNLCVLLLFIVIHRKILGWLSIVKNVYWNNFSFSHIIE